MMVRSRALSVARTLSGVVAAICMLVMLPVEMAWSSIWIHSVDGDKANCKVVRDGATLKIRRLLKLQKDDIVRVDRPGSKLGILLEDKSIKYVTSRNSPYTVTAANTGSSFIDNVIVLASNWFKAGATQSSQISAIAKSTNAMRPVSIDAAPAEQNFLLSGQTRLDISWRGGTSPYQALLVSDDGAQVYYENKSVNGTSISIDGLRLQPGSYRLEVSTEQMGSITTSVAQLEVVERPDLPDNALKVIEANVPAELKNQLLVTLLAQDPEWKFQAYSMARQHGFEEARLAILKNLKPGKE